MVNRVPKYRSATMVVRVVKLSLIHKIAVLPRGGQEWFLARGLLSRLETRRKLISFLPVIGIHELYEPTECQRGEKASLASYSSIVVPCSGFYSSTVIDYDLLENISGQVPSRTDSLRSRKTNGKVVYALKRSSSLNRIYEANIVGVGEQNVGAKRYPLAIRLIEYLGAKGLLSLLTGFSFSFVREPSCW